MLRTNKHKHHATSSDPNIRTATGHQRRRANLRHRSSHVSRTSRRRRNCQREIRKGRQVPARRFARLHREKHAQGRRLEESRQAGCPLSNIPPDAEAKDGLRGNGAATPPAIYHARPPGNQKAPHMSKALNHREWVYEEPHENVTPITYQPKPKPITLETLAEGAGEKTGILHHGVNGFPTDADPKSILVGVRGQIRVAENHFFNSYAGGGKSTSSAGMAMAWGLGLPYMGLTPTRPLRILHMNGEDDEATMGQCREGFLRHSEAITGRRLTRANLAPLDTMLRTDFSREYVGPAFVTRLDKLLSEVPADILFINPLLSFIGGEIVAEASNFLRVLLGPLLMRHQCAALTFHHTVKLNRDSWQNMDPTYSGIGGGEVANVPRSVFTLQPTAVEGLARLFVAKRKLADWKDADGKYSDHAYFRRTEDSTRPAWLPVNHAEALELIGETAKSGGAGSGRKADAEDVFAALESGAMSRTGLLDYVQRVRRCSETVAKAALSSARRTGKVHDFSERNAKTGRAEMWFCMAHHKEQFDSRSDHPTA